MSVLLHTGATALPGDVLYVADARVSRGGGDACAVVSWAAAHAHEAVTPGEGCYIRLAAAAATDSGDTHAAQLYAVACCAGVVQWDGARVSVYARPRLGHVAAARQHDTTTTTTTTVTNAAAATTAGSSDERERLPSAVTATAATTRAFGPSPGDAAHVRITRVTRLFASGDIVAVNGVWCSGTTAQSASGGFRGVLRVEDIRPFRPSKDALQPPAPSLAFQPGDVVVAQVLSQSDVRQYQLSTMPEHCGVVEAYAQPPHAQSTSPLHGGSSGGGSYALQHIPRRRDAMLDPITRQVVPRWCPLVRSLNE